MIFLSGMEIIHLVGEAGFEPARPQPHAPKACASTIPPLPRCFNGTCRAPSLWIPAFAGMTGVCGGNGGEVGGNDGGEHRFVRTVPLTLTLSHGGERGCCGRRGATGCVRQDDGGHTPLWCRFFGLRSFAPLSLCERGDWVVVYS